MAQLSGGNQQKVVVGKWLSLRPRVLLLNDPTKGVDVGTRQNIYGIIHELTKQGTSVLLYASDNEELIDNCDRVLIVFEGRIVKEMKGDDIDEEKIVVASLHVEHTQKPRRIRRTESMSSTARLKGIVQDSSFPSFLMLVLLIIVNAILQPGFFSFQVFRMNFMTFTPLILVSLAQATLLLVGAVDLSLGAGISLVTAVMASLMHETRRCPSCWCRSWGSAVAVGLSLFNGVLHRDHRPPAPDHDFRHLDDLVRARPPAHADPGRPHPRGILRAVRQELAGLLSRCPSSSCSSRWPSASCSAGCARSATSTRWGATSGRRGPAASTSRARRSSPSS